MPVAISISNVSDDALQHAVKSHAAHDPNGRVVILTEQEYASLGGSVSAPPLNLTNVPEEISNEPNEPIEIDSQPVEE